MIDTYIMIWHLNFINLKTILRSSIVGGMPLKHTHVVPSLNIECTPRGCNTFTLIEVQHDVRNVVSSTTFLGWMSKGRVDWLSWKCTNSTQLVLW